MPAPTCRSFEDYLARTTLAERIEYCGKRAQKADQPRESDPPPTPRLGAADVWPGRMT
jgi:hypothetical protein